MKQTIYMVLIISLLGCSSEDDNLPSFDVKLLYGQWNFPNVCPDQNNIAFNEDGTYRLTESGNTCNENTQNTYAYSGTYDINGDNLSFNQQSEELIEEGVNPGFDTDGSELISQKILSIDETELFIERQFRVFSTTEYRNWLLIRQQ